MGSALLSRFDLVFILLDTPNEDHDHLLSEHVIAIRAGKQRAVSSATVARMNSQDSNTSILEVVSDKPLSERLKVSFFSLIIWFSFVWKSEFSVLLVVEQQYVNFLSKHLLYYNTRVCIKFSWDNLSQLDQELELQSLVYLENIILFSFVNFWKFMFKYILLQNINIFYQNALLTFLHHHNLWSFTSFSGWKRYWLLLKSVFEIFETTFKLTFKINLIYLFLVALGLGC